MHVFRQMAVLLLLGLCIASGGMLRSAPVGKGDGKPLTAIEEIRKALDATTDIDFANQPLPTVLSALGEDHKLVLTLDRFAVQTSGMEPNELMVDIHLKKVKLRNGLRTLLGQYNLSFSVVGSEIFISTEEGVIGRQLRQRISVEAEEKPLSKFMKDLSRDYGVNILIDPRCIKQKKTDEPVTLALEDVPLETVVRLACEIGSLKPVRMGNVLFVTTEDRADKLRDQELSPGVLPGGFPGLINPNQGGIGLAPIPAQAIPAAPLPPVVEEKKN